MKKAILRNIAFVSAIFIVVMSIMLVTNYFQVRGATPLQTTVMETLKQLNETNSNNPQLQEEIRQLDLMSRKAYFVQHDHLMVGIYILFGMLAVFVVCTHFYFADRKNIPDKELDPIDEWANKTLARKYVIGGAVVIAAVALVFGFMSSPFLKLGGKSDKPAKVTVEAASGDSQDNAELTASADTSAVADSTSAPVSGVTSNSFRGNISNGISSAKGVPTSWNLKSGKNIAWKVSVPRAGRNSPIINGNKVFLSGADSKARELYCFDLLTGKQLWKASADNIPGSPRSVKTKEDAGMSASSVSTNGKQVCAIFATGDILCTDMDGKRVWAKNLGVPSNLYGYSSSLIMFGNAVYVEYDNQNSPRVIALDAATGRQLWSTPRKEKTTWSSPSIAYVGGKPQLVLMGNPSISGYNLSNGKQLWHVDCLSGEVASSPCSSNGIVYGASEYAKLVAVNGTDGKVLWESSDYLPEVSSPVATKSNLYLATSYGVFAAFNTQTGQLRKSHELNVEFYSSPVIVEGRIYLFSNDGKMFIFSADDNCKLLASFDTGEKTFATPAFTDGRIVVRTEKSIYCVKKM